MKKIKDEIVLVHWFKVSTPFNTCSYSETLGVASKVVKLLKRENNYLSSHIEIKNKNGTNGKIVSFFKQTATNLKQELELEEFGKVTKVLAVV